MAIVSLINQIKRVRTFYCSILEQNFYSPVQLQGLQVRSSTKEAVEAKSIEVLDARQIQVLQPCPVNACKINKITVAALEIK